MDLFAQGVIGWEKLVSHAPALGFWTIAIALYCVIVYRFYRFIASRDVFGFDAHAIEVERKDLRRRVMDTLMGFGMYGVLFPIAVFIWFAAFAVMLFFLAKDLSLEQILVVAACFVAAIRLVSYYKQDLSRDMAKLIPFVVLGAIIIEPDFFSVSLAVTRFQALSSFLPELAAYFLFLVLVEWVLRVALALKHVVLGVSVSEKQKE